MRRVVPSSQVIPLWLAQSQDSATNPQRNFFFNGSAIFSFGEHFPIAVRVDRPGRDMAVLFTSREHGPITGQHKRAVYRAICDCYQVFTVPDPLAGWIGRHTENLIYYRQRAVELTSKAIRARRADSRVAIQESLNALVDETRRYIDYFKLNVIPPGALAEQRCRPGRKTLRRS